ncbi:hypothetical protein EBZ37_15260 [bacterium]|nr:hypothetical protein [bacterium]
MLTLLISLVFASSAQAQSAYPGHLLLSELPDGAKLQVLERIELSTTHDDAHGQMTHTCTFEDGTCSATSETHFFSSYHSQLNLKTDVEDALIRTAEGWFTDDYSLLPGIYCLNRSRSSFHSTGDNHVDKLKFDDCAGNLVFTIYANAGYNLRNRDGFQGYTISEFDFQAGTQIRFVK